MVELKFFPTDQASTAAESSGRKNNCTMQVKANSLKMIDGVSLLFQMVLRAEGREIANEQWGRVSAASICFYLRPRHVDH